MKMTAVLLALLMAAVLFVGCNNGSQQGGEKTSLTLGCVSDITSFNVADGQEMYDFVIRRCLYEPLVHVDPNTGEEVMRLAENYETSDDHTVYTFHLRKDVKMHDGSTLTADDVVFSLNMTKASPDVDKNLSAMKEAKAVDASTVEIILESPYAAFMQGLSMVFIQSKSAYETAGADAYNNAPVGPGPYKFVSYENENKVTLTAFDDYYGNAPAIKDIELRQFQDANALAIALEAQEIDAAYNISPVSVMDLKSNDSIAITEIPSTVFMVLAMNTQQEPFNDVNLRKAICYAIDNQSIVDSARDGIGTATTNILNLSLPFMNGAAEYEHNAEKAKSILEEAGYTLPYKLDCPLTIHSGIKTEAEVVKSNLEAAGIIVEINTVEPSVLYTDATNGSIGLSLLKVGTSSIDGDQYGQYVCTFGIGSNNYAQYSNAEVDRLFEEARCELDTAKRNQLYKEAVAILNEEAVYCGIYQQPMIAANNADLNADWGLNNMYYLSNFSWK